MTTTIELTEAGTTAFNTWFDSVARDNVRREAVCFELLDQLRDRVDMGESLVYELGRQYTTTGRPEHLHLAAADIEVTTEADE